MYFSCIFTICFLYSDASFLSVFENHTTDQLESSDTAYSNQHEHKDVSPKTISGLLFNARSLSSKQQDFRSFLALNPMDIVFVTETWMSPSHTDTISSCMSGYTSIRRDRDSRGGGIMITVNDQLQPVHLDQFDSNGH